MSDQQSDRNAQLLEAGLALAAELSLPAVLKRIIELAVQITGATYCALGVLGPDGTIGDFITTGISDEQRAAIGHLPVGKGILGVLIHDAEPLRLHRIGDDPRSVGFPPNHPKMESFLGAPVKAYGRVYGNIYLTQKRGAADFSDEDERAVLMLATQAGVAIENARLYEEARQREQRLEAVRESATAILSGIAPEIVLELVARRACELVNADLATVAMPGSSPETLVLQVTEGAHADELRGMTFTIEESVYGAVIRSGEPIVLEDASGDDGTYQPMVDAGEIGPAMFVPLQVRGTSFGTLAVANRAGGRRFTPDDLTLVQTFAGQASVAIEYGRAQRELKRLAVMEDRERIAKELHDGVIQSLFAVGMGLQASSAMSADQELERRIDGAVNEIDRVIRDLRNYIFGLRPGILADRQIDQALRELAADFEEKSGVTTAVDIDPRIAAELASSGADLIQLAREALSNVGRHAQATTCRLSLYRSEGGGVLEIDDDGSGFDTAAAAGRGQGLGNLRDRAASLHGQLEITSIPAQGTTVRVTIPL